MIRKGLARMLQAAAVRLETDQSIESVSAKVKSGREKLAKFILPDDSAFTIDPAKIKH